MSNEKQNTETVTGPLNPPVPEEGRHQGGSATKAKRQRRHVKLGHGQFVDAPRPGEAPGTKGQGAGTTAVNPNQPVPVKASKRQQERDLAIWKHGMFYAATVSKTKHWHPNERDGVDALRQQIIKEAAELAKLPEDALTCI